MKDKRCGGPENTPDEQDSRTTTVKTGDGCERAHVDMGTGQVTYTQAEDGACGLKDETKKRNRRRKGAPRLAQK